MKKRVLVTGADGFIGSHLTELLVREGYSVRALSQYNSFNSWGWLEDIKELNKVDVVSGDIRDLHFCRHLTKDIDLIFHLAALIAIPYSYISPDSYFETNVRGTLNVCQAALDNNVSRLIHTSTSEVYGTAQYVPIDELHQLQPQSPYSASKIGADAVAMSFFNTFNLPVTIARPFNTYGPRQSARAVIPTIITQIASGLSEIKLGDVSPTRDFNYISDTCAALLALAKCEEATGETVNIGSNFEISIEGTLNIIREIMGSNVNFITESIRNRPATSEVYRLWCDNSKLKSLTGFESRIGIHDGLKATVQWMSNPVNLAKYKTMIYNT